MNFKAESILKDKFQILYTKYVGMVYSRCYQLTGKKETAWDLVHDVYLLIFKQYHTFKNNSDIYTWIYRITTNVCINYLRKEIRSKSHSIKIEMDLSDEFQTVKRIDHNMFLKQVFRTFDKTSRQIAYLYFIDDSTQDEIATIMGISRKTVSRKIQLLKTKLKKLTSQVKHYEKT